MLVTHFKCCKNDDRDEAHDVTVSLLLYYPSDDWFSWTFQQYYNTLFEQVKLYVLSLLLSLWL